MALERKPTGAYDAAYPVTVPGGGVAYAPFSVSGDANGNAVVSRESLALVTNNTVAPAQSAYGGDYYIRAIATNWNSASVRIQFLDVDGATWTNLQNVDGTDVTPFTANRTQVTGLGSNASIRAVVTGAPTGLYVKADRVPA